jgi:hypothetical protein
MRRSAWINDNRVMGEGAVARRAVARRLDWMAPAGAAASAAVAVAAWPFRGLQPGIGADWEWVAGLSYAAEHGLRFGERIAWSYGPLGFLTTPYGPVLYYGDILLLSWLFAALVQLLLAGVLLVSLRRSFPPAVAVLVAVVVLALTPDRALALGFALCALALTRDDEQPRERAAAFPFALGALTAVGLLGKLNQGVELAALAAVTLAATPSRARRRDVARFAGALLATAAAGWLASGQTIADVWPYVRNGAQVIAGYAAAMGTTDPAHRWTYLGALAIVALALALAWGATRGARRQRRWGLLALCAVYAFFDFKEGFVRQAPNHLEWFFGDMLVLFAVLPARRAWRALPLASVAAGVVALGAVLGFHELASTLNPYANVKAAADQVRTLASPARQAALTSALRRGIALEYPVPPQLLAAIGRRTVMLWPDLFAEVAYAYGLDLRPLPAFEPYAAYTPALDRLGARMLASSRAPDRIMRALAQPIDGRHPTFESPLATLAIFCRYRELVVRAPWQALARSGDRCGAPRVLRTVTAPWGAQVAVPRPDRPDAIVLVRVDGAGPHGLERVKALLLRPNRRWIALDGVGYPLVAATAADGLLLRAPPDLDYPRPFAMAPNPSRIAVSRGGSEPGGTLRYTFVELAVRRFPPTTRTE